MNTTDQEYELDLLTKDVMFANMLQTKVIIAQDNIQKSMTAGTYSSLRKYSSVLEEAQTRQQKALRDVLDRVTELEANNVPSHLIMRSFAQAAGE